jgi:hypothetical protein
MDALRPKLKPDGIIVSLSPYRAGISALADYVIPAPAFAESAEDAPTPWDAAVPSYASAPALLEAPAGVLPPLLFLNRVTGATATPDSLMRARLDGLFKAKRGDVFAFSDRSKKPVAGFKSADDFAKAFATGACWIDETANAIPVKCGGVNGSPHAAAGKIPEALSRRPAVDPPLMNGGRA